MRSVPGSQRRPSFGTTAAALAAVVLLMMGGAMACQPASTPGDRFTETLAALEPDLAEAAALRLDADAREVLVDLESLRSLQDAERDVVDPPWEALARAYDTPWPAAVLEGEGPDEAALQHWRATAAERVRPYAILVEDDGRAGELAFLGAYWTSPLSDRLRVVRPPRGATVGRAPGAILDALETCAVEVQEWIIGDASLAQRLLSRESGSPSMFVAGWREETNRVVRTWVAPEDVLDALRFDHPATRDLPSFSAWFTGSGPGPVAVARAMPGVRSSMGPRALFRLLRDIQ